MPQILTFDVFASDGADGADGADGLQFPGGRLSLASGDPLPATDQTAKTTVYYTPYVHNFISLYADGAWTWNLIGSEKSVSVPATTNTPFDVFGYLDAGDLAIETLSWTNDTTRATALARQDGFLVKSGDSTRLYLGTCRTTASSGQCEDSENKRFVWNAFNRVDRRLFKNISGSGYTYSTNTYRQANADSANQVAFVVGLSGTTYVRLQYNTLLSSTVASAVANVGIGKNVTNATSAFQLVTCLVTTAQFVVCNYQDLQPIGYTFLAAIEKGAGTGTQTWTNDNIDRGLVGSMQC